MWARTFEFVLAIWLGISWIIFSYQGEDFYLLWNDFSCFLLISLFSLISYVEKLRHLHLLNFVIGLWLFGFSYYVRSHFEHDTIAQNYMFISLLLLLFAIIPSHARRPPYQWIKFMANKKF